MDSEETTLVDLVKATGGFNVVARKAEVSTTALWSYQNGKNFPRLDVAKRLSEALEISMSELLDLIIQAKKAENDE